jgi:hypothetical protein
MCIVSPRYTSEIADLRKKNRKRGVAFPVSCLLMIVENEKEQEFLLLLSWFIIVNDKMQAYAFILTHEGYPCVFWQDYFNWRLGEAWYKSGVAALVRVHEDHAGGETSVLYVDDNLYIMQRSGAGAQKGLIFVMNNRGDA